MDSELIALRKRKEASSFGTGRKKNECVWKEPMEKKLDYLNFLSDGGHQPICCREAGMA